MSSNADPIRVPIAAEVLADALGGHDDYRVLRRLAPMRREGQHDVRKDCLVGVVVDVETTGLDHRGCRIIELALQRFRADAEARIVETGRARDWLEDPGEPLDPAISRLTRLSDHDLRGRRIADAEAAAILSAADFVISHNAGFDRPFVERRLPEAAGRPWICSMRDMAWDEAGFEGRSLSHLVSQCGHFYQAHRADADVNALLHLLDYRLDSGRTVLGELISTASRPSWLVEAAGAPFSAKDALKARGYRWDADRKIWHREVKDDDVGGEIAWAEVAVYRGDGEPLVRRVTWTERYAAA